MVKKIVFISLLLIIFAPLKILAEDTQSVCVLLKQADTQPLVERVLEPLTSYFEKRNNMQNMITSKGLAYSKNIQKNIETLDGYKSEMQEDKDKIMAFFTEMEKCMADELETAEKFPEDTIAEYYEIKDKMAKFFKLDQYLIKGFDKTIKFMAERRGAYFVKEGHITFARMNDWEYFRYMKRQLKEIMRQQNLVLNSVKYGR